MDNVIPLPGMLHAYICSKCRGELFRLITQYKDFYVVCSQCDNAHRVGKKE